MSVTALQHDDKQYLIGKLSVMDAPTDEELASWGVGEELRRQAPNENIVWLTGHYVSAGQPNRNGQAWSADEIAIKSLTPRLMPVTVMHRPRDVVGVIADARINMPTAEAASAGEQPSITTVLAIWGHRFPEVAAEIAENTRSGMLMQSMECDAPMYDCSECGQRYVKPVEETAHCEHLTNGSGHRTLVDVTFTGTGLIFGSRGAQGADPSAYLAEVAEWAEARSELNDKDDDDRDADMTKVEIDKAEYDELVAAKAELKAMQRKVGELEPKAAEAEELETKLTEAEVKTQEAQTEAQAAKDELAALKEERAADELAAERLSKLPAEVAKKLPSSTAGRLAKKARSLSEEEWTEEVAEVAQLLGIKADGDPAGETFAEQAIRGFNPNGGVSDPKTGGDAGVTAQSVASGLAHMLRTERKGK